MPFKQVPQKYSAAINSVTVGVGEQAITLGGSSALPLQTFDAPIEHMPKIGVELNGTAFKDDPIMSGFYASAESLADAARLAAGIAGVDFLCLSFESADPSGDNKSVDDCVADAEAVAAAVELPLVIMGCQNADKDAVLFEKLAAALSDKNVLFMSAKEENYKTVGAAAGLAYKQKISAESAVDINLAKQLNVLLSQLGVDAKSLCMNVGSAAAGYGFEYVASTMERVKLAALSQDDTMLQMPIITPVSGETWGVKESMVSEADMPQWGSREQRGVDMEIVTAVASLVSGSDAVILRHPASIETVSAFINCLL